MTAEKKEGVAGPVRLRDPFAYRQRPVDLSDIVVDSTDELGRWQHLNGSATLPHVVAQMETSGVLDNLRKAIAGEGEFIGPPFADSDLYKTLEAVAWETARTGANPFPEFLETSVDLLGRAQREDGYLNSHFQLPTTPERWSDLRMGHELYCAGHLIQAAVAWNRANGDDRLLAISRRVVDHIWDVLGPDGRVGFPGHPEIETALMELYRETGDERSAELAALFLERRSHLPMSGPAGFASAYYQNDVPVRESTTAMGHAVRQLYLSTGVADLALEKNDPGLTDAAVRVWTDAIETKTYLTGGQGSRHRDESFGDAYELPPERAYAETCAGIASFMLSYRLLMATDEARYAFEMERVLRNGVLSGVALDGEHFFYSNPLQMRTGHRPEAEDSPAERLSWYGCACCPPNLARLGSSLASYLATCDERGVTLQIPAATTLSARGDGWSARVCTETDAPYGGRIGAVVEQTTGTWRLRLRVPAGASAVTATVNGEPVAVEVDGYAEIEREWKAGDSVIVEAAVPVRAVHPHPYVDAVRGSIAMMKGPLVYCLETASAERKVVLEDLRVTPDDVRAAEPAPVPELETTGLVLTAHEVAGADLPLYGDVPAPTASAPVRVTAIPYARWANRGPTAMRVWVPTL
ncbi:glycoside hydrolase family 127 protein [Demequina sp. NBRC 110054]|uniref:glycoside hydrolase family 127 protein n=1 Tax=Demequina sp. NBRC 110054 TaxID=1570343 RepID=UPI0013565C32|nr:beta-L-arabinofuranosidase domain-containing protein [Demequina sp. NBRC 110054]